MLLIKKQKYMNSKSLMALLLSLTLVLGGCKSLSNAAKDGMIGGGAGAAIGAIIGGIAGDGVGAAIGAAVGGAVGGTAGALIGRKMDKKAAEAEKIPGAEVQQVEDKNGLAAVKVTFNSGILFGFNSSTLSNQAKQSLREFADLLKSDPTIDVAIIGHTDKVGTYEANQQVSAQRAYAVENYLESCGVPPAQFKKVEGVGYTQYNEALTPDQNRCVDIYMYASEQMIKNAEAGK